MAITILGQDGFGWLTTPTNFTLYWADFFDRSILTIGAGPNGLGKAVRWNQSGSSYHGYAWSKAFTPASKVCGEGHYNFDVLGNGEIMIFFLSGSAVMSVQITNAGAIQFVILGTVIASSAATLIAGTWYKIQVQVYSASSGGRVQIYVNNNLVIDFTGNTSFSGNTTLDAVRFQMKDGVSSGYFANPVWYTFATIGTDRLPYDNWIRTVRAAAVGTHNDFSTNTGTKTAAINDTDPDMDATYNFSAATGLIDSFTIAALGLTQNPNAVGVKYISRKDNIGASALSTLVRTHATDYTGTSIGQGTSYQCFSDAWVLNPNTGLPWTPAEVDAIEFGYKDTR